MNNDDTHSGSGSAAPEDTEARIVAWLLGEADAAEAAALEAMIAADPTLADLKARLERLLGLVGQAQSADADAPRLSDERRSELLRTLSAPSQAQEAAADPYAFPALAAERRRRFTVTMSLLAAAACVTLGVFLSIDRQTEARHVKARAVLAYDGSAEKKEVLEGQMEMQKREQMRYNAEAKRSQAVLEKQLAEDKGSAAFAVEMPAAPASAGEAVPEEPVLNNARQLQAASSLYYSLQSPAAAGSDSLSRTPQAVTGSGQPPVVAFNAPMPDAPAVYDAGSFGSGGLRLPAARVAPPAEATAMASPIAVSLDDELSKSRPAANTLAGTRVRTVDADTGDENRDLKTDSAKVSAPIAGLGAVAGDKLAGKDADLGDNGAELTAAQQPLSTFSLHVGDASFVLAAQALAAGEVPDPAAIRPEEFYNAFDYGDPVPSMAEKVSCHVEQAAHPFDQQRNLIRIAMRVPDTGRGPEEPLSLTLLLDTSGSMERADRAAAVKRAMQTLVSLLGAQDRVTLIGFSRRPRLMADSVPGNEAAKLLDIVSHTPPEGGTNLEEAVRLAGQIATREFRVGAQNRIILLTDGATNLGDVEPAHLSALVEPLRQQSIAFDACGVGTNGIDDAVLEALARKGAGRYYVLGSPEQADEGFARQVAGSLRPAAEKVKVQVRFNPSRVGAYRLVGFEQHRLAAQDFRNDRVGDSSLARGEAAVAVYEVEPLGQGEGELGEVTVRFRDTGSGETVERGWTLPYDPAAPSLDKASPTLQLAGAATLVAEKLRGGARADGIKLARLAPEMNMLRARYARSERVQQLASMYDQMRRLNLE